MLQKIVDTRGDYARAYNWFLTAQGECPHWDYDNPDGCGAQCCLDMQKAERQVKLIGKQLSPTHATRRKG